MWAAAPPKPWPPTTIRTAARRRPVPATNILKYGEGRTSGGDLRLARALKSDVPSGADVLKALERATAQKTKKKKMDTSRNRDIEQDKEAPRNFDNVSPLCINPEWGDQLEELQTRLQHITCTPIQ